MFLKYFYREIVGKIGEKIKKRLRSKNKTNRKREQRRDKAETKREKIKTQVTSSESMQKRGQERAEPRQEQAKTRLNIAARIDAWRPLFTFRAKTGRVKTPQFNPNLSLFSGLPGEIHAHDEVPVAAVLVEPLGAEVEGHERHVRVVHGLQLDPRVGAVPRRLVQQVLDGLQDLLEEAPLHEAGFEHGGGCVGGSGGDGD